MGKVPEVHVSNPHLMDITYVDEVVGSPGDMRQRPEQLMGATVINEAEQFSRIFIFRQKPSGNNDLFDFRDSIYHEIGHVVYHFLVTEKQKKIWHQLHSETTFIWTVAGTNPAEHFAEMYAHYILHKESTERFFPREYSFLKNEVFLAA